MLINPCLCALGDALRVLHFKNKDNKISVHIQAVLLFN